MNKIVITLVLLMAGSAPAMAMQRQRTQDQHQQTQKKKDKKKQNQNNNDNANPIEDTAPDAATADLNVMLAGIMNQINQAHGSVDAMVTHLKTKDHQRICPTCGQPAELCETDKGRLAHGNVMLCGCSICGGLQV